MVELMNLYFLNGRGDLGSILVRIDLFLFFENYYLRVRIRN